MTKLEQLAEIAKEAQRNYDTAVHEAKTKPKVALEQGEIRCYSDKQGFSWDCNADGQSIARHTAKTVESAFTVLDSKEGGDMHKITLAMGIMKALNKVAKIEANRD